MTLVVPKDLGTQVGEHSQQENRPLWVIGGDCCRRQSHKEPLAVKDSTQTMNILEA